MYLPEPINFQNRCFVAILLVVYIYHYFFYISLYFILHIFTNNHFLSFLSDIVNRYSLQDVIHVPAVTNEVTDNDIPPELKDKKLQKLWEKAGNSGFSGEIIFFF
jgi:hypothetical protein